MAICEVCGNDYDKAFEVTMMGKTHTFDSFECAVHALAPACAHCGVKIAGHGLENAGHGLENAGHGLENAGRIYCCAHCAGQEGATELRDRA